MTSPLRYAIKPANPAAHLFEVRLTLDEPAADGQVFVMPAWIPGSYMIRDYARHVVGIRAESDGLDVPLSKLDKSRWQAAPVGRALTVIAEIYAYDESVRGAHLDNTHAYFNGTCVFLEPEGLSERACEVEILPPDKPVGKDWRVATSMRRDGAEQYGFGRYAAANYAELIDHPVEIGQLSIAEFEVDGIPHALAIRGRQFADMTRLCHDIETVCSAHMKMLPPPKDLDRYLFLLHVTANGYGGLEHCWSSSLVAARGSLPAKSADDISEAYRGFLGLVSHEYFHLWNVKRMKPAAFHPYELSRETYTGLLWVYEGVTSYYDDLTLLRSGLIDAESYLELLGRVMTRVRRGKGRQRQSVEASSFDAWTKFYKQDANSGNAIVSYYAKGSLIALALDLKLRDETDGRVSLDDVTQECWRRFGETGQGMQEREIEAICHELSGLDLEDFFDAAVRGTGELPLDKLLERHGVRVHYRAASGAKDLGGKAATELREIAFGAAVTDSAGTAVVTAVANDMPAEAAGVAPGDQLVALGGLRLTAANLDGSLQRFRAGDKAELVVFRGDELLTLSIVFTAAPEDTIYLELIAEDEADSAALERRKALLQA
ncbi:MAG: PDZ domain-containing protein [Pseudomonadota bacterium]